MADTISESWQIFMDQYPQVMKLIRQFAKQDWYVEGGWTTFLGYYHGGIYFQVFKPHWYNQTGDGIHLESGLDARTLESNILDIDLHIGHKNLFDRERFNAYATPRIEELVKTWDGEVWLKTHTISERLGMRLKFTKTGFPQQVTTAFTQLATLGPIIDDGLAQL